MNKFIYFILCLLCMSCSASKPPSKHVQIADALTREYCQTAKAKDSLYVFGTGGAMCGDIKRFTIAFFTHQTLTIPEVRCLVVKKIEEFLELINSSIEIRPYLHNYPWTVENFELQILFKSKGPALQPPYVFLVLVINGNIVYDYNNSETDTLQTALRETYDEAYEIVYGKEKYDIDR